MTTHLVQGKEYKKISRDEIIVLSSGYQEVVFDIGSGDGKGSFRYAKQNLDKLVIAIDSSYEALQETSRQALKKQNRGGATNLICLYGNIKESSADLEAISDFIRIYLPWGDLLEGIAEKDKDMLTSISRCSKQGGNIEIVINGEIWKNNLPKHLGHLGMINPEFFMTNIDIFSNYGIQIHESYKMNTEEIKQLNTTWTAKLMSSRDIADFIMAKGECS